MKLIPFLTSALFCLWGASALFPAGCEKRSDEVVVGVSNDNPEMKAAREEAVKRFPEFLAAFDKRKIGDAFAVKVGFPVRNSTEHEYMWILVRKIQGDVLSGTLESEPVNDVGLKYRDEVSANRADIHDWMYAAKGKEPVGGFQSEVLRKLQKEQGR